MKYYLSYFIIIICFTACTNSGQTKNGEINVTNSKKSHLEKVADSLVDYEIGIQNIESKLSNRHLKQFRDSLVSILVNDERFTEEAISDFGFHEFLFNTYNAEPFIEVTFSYGTGASISRVYFYFKELELHTANTIIMTPSVQQYLESEGITLDKIQFRVKNDRLVLMAGGFLDDDAHCCPTYQVTFTYQIIDDSIYITELSDIQENTEI